MRHSLAAATGALTLLLAACGSTASEDTSGELETSGPLTDAEFDQLVQDAQDEGQLTLYSTPGEETMRAWVKDFEAAYGIEVEIYRATVSDIYRRFSEESQAGQHLADVVSMSVPSYIEESVSAGWAVPLHTRSYDDIDPALITADAGYPLYAVITSIAWNENEVSEELAERLAAGDYTALLDDELQDRVGIVAPTAGGMQLGAHLTIVDDPELGWDFLDDLVENGAVTFESSVPFVANDLSSGEFAAGIAVPDSVAIPRIYEGSPIRIGYPQPAPASMHQFFLSANAPHSAAGRLFMEWGSSVEAQSSLAEISGGLVAHEKWQDNRTITSEGWYHAPAAGIDVAWQEGLGQDESDEAIQEWLDHMG